MRLSLIVLSSLPALGMAAWTSSPLVLSNNASEQVQTKVRTAPDGTAFVSWFDNSAGGYDVYLQKVDPNGDPQWAANGLLVADRAFSSTVDYDLAVDNAGNAYITFNDDRLGGNRITVQKVSPAGTLLWGPNGVQVTSTGSPANPKVAVLPNGTIMAGWSISPGFTMQRLDALGNLIGTTTTVSESGRTITLSDLEPGLGGEVIAFWIRPFTTSFLSNKWLYAQKYNSSGSPMWNSGSAFAPLSVYSMSGVSGYGTAGGSVQNGYFPIISPDGNGGFVSAWYESAGPRNAYLQHVDGQGIRKFGPNGVATALTPGRMRISASVAYDPWFENYFVITEESDISPQTNYTITAQKFDIQGSRQWTDAGLTLLPVNGFQKSFSQATLQGDGVMASGFDARSATTGVVYKAAVSEAGTALYGVATPEFVFSGVSGKSRMAAWLSASGDTLTTWTDGASGTGDAFAQRVGPANRNGNGTVRVVGTISAPDFVGDITQVNWRIRVSSSESVPEVHVVRCINSLGNFTFDSNVTGLATVTLDGSHWINRTVSNVSLSSGPINFTPPNGDADRSGEVDAADIDAVIAGFGAALGGSSYNVNIDLDGSGEVDAADIDIAIANFGAFDN